MSKYQTGNKNGMWKGGRTVTKSGYVLVRVGKDHPLADTRGYAYEHRLVASEKLGRLIRPEEPVHHIDGNKINNTPDNLIVASSDVEHHFYHRKTKDSKRRKPGEDNPLIPCQCGCGNLIYKYDKDNRPRSFVSGHNGHKRANNGQWKSS